MQRRRRLELLLLVSAPFGLALAAPSSASAHLRTATVAVAVAARVTSSPAPVHARVYLSDRALHVSVAPGHTLVVLGYLGEAFARVGARGATVDRASPTAQSANAVVDGRSLTWHDDRLQRLSPGGQPVSWRVPVVVDGRRTAIVGVVWRPRPPTWWPWLVAAGLLAAAAGVRRRTRVATSVSLGLASAACALASGAGFAFGAYASPGTWIALLDELAFALAGVGVLAWGPRHIRPAVGGCLGLLGLAVALVQVPVFLHPVVLSALPADVTRALATAAVGAGAGAAFAAAAHYAR